MNEKEVKQLIMDLSSHLGSMIGNYYSLDHCIAAESRPGLVSYKARIIRLKKLIDYLCTLIPAEFKELNPRDHRVYTMWLSSTGGRT